MIARKLAFDKMRGPRVLPASAPVPAQTIEFVNAGQGVARCAKREVQEEQEGLVEIGAKEVQVFKEAFLVVFVETC